MKRAQKNRILVFIYLIILAIGFNNCSGGTNVSPALGSSDSPQNQMQDFGADKLSLDLSFAQSGCYQHPEPNFDGWGVRAASLRSISSGLLMVYPQLVAKHLSNGDLDTSWGDSGYLRSTQVQSITGIPENAYSLLGVDSQDRLYVKANNYICRLNLNLTLDTTWGPTTPSYPGCVSTTYNGILVEDVNQNMWTVTTLQSLILVTKFSQTGQLLLNGHTLGVRTTWVTGFGVNNYVIAQDRLHISYTSVDAAKVSTGRLVSFDIDSNQIIENSSDYLNGKNFSKVGVSGQGSLLLALKDENSNGLLHELQKDFTSNVSFNSNQPITLNLVNSALNFGEMRDGGTLISWQGLLSNTSTKYPFGQILRLDGQGKAIARLSSTKEVYQNVVAIGGYTFALNVAGLIPKLCRLSTP